MEQDKQSQLFMSLILMLQMQCMLHLGKIANPIDGTTSRDLDAAKATIDLLDMMQFKTAGNLSDYEKKSLEHILSDLKLNYVDEKEKSDKKDGDSKSATVDELKEAEESNVTASAESEATGKSDEKGEDTKEETDKKEN